MSHVSGFPRDRDFAESVVHAEVVGRPGRQSLGEEGRPRRGSQGVPLTELQGTVEVCLCYLCRGDWDED